MDQLIEIKSYLEGQISAFKMMQAALKSDYNEGIIAGLKLAIVQIDIKIDQYDQGQSKELANG